MLSSIHVKNVALIDETEVSFHQGFNVLTGETGAGKSLLIGSIQLALGGKADMGIIRSGEENAQVELVFQTKDESALSLLAQWDIPVEEDDIVTISRKISPGKNIIKINGETANLKQVKTLAELLLDLHGQHDHQSLLKKQKHLEILDSFAGAELQKYMTPFSEAYKKHAEVKALIESENQDEETRKKEINLARFEYQEIEEANLKIGEDEELESVYRKLKSAKRIGEVLSSVQYLIGNEEEGGAGASLGRAIREVNGISSLDSKLEEFSSELSDAEAILSDLNREIDSYLSDFEEDPEKFFQIEERLNLVNRLKDKYGDSIEKVLAYKEQKEKEIEKLEDFDNYLASLRKKEEDSRLEMEKLALQISDIRKKKAVKLTEVLTNALKELSFREVKLEISMKEKEEISRDGMDDVEFLISTNIGERVKSLSDVASGGELSRIMLAIKTVMADKDGIDTLIFDEIDSGISGRTAWEVASKIGTLSKHHQVIAITHLAQIAARADSHYRIEKSNDGVRTNTNIQELNHEESLQELARLLGSESISDSAMENAKELWEKAHNA